MINSHQLITIAQAMLARVYVIHDKSASRPALVYPTDPPWTRTYINMCPTRDSEPWNGHFTMNTLPSGEESDLE
jgi:hypothetical protein